MSSAPRGRAVAIGAIVGALVLVVASAVAFGDDGRTPRGITVDGIALPSSGEPTADLEAQAAAWLDGRITLDAGVRVLSASRRELGARVDVPVTRAAIGAIGRGPLAMLDRARARLFGHEVPLVRGFDAATTQDLLVSLRNRIDRAPQLAGAGGEGSPVRTGLRLDVMAAVPLIERVLSAGSTYVRLPVERLVPRDDARASIYDVATFTSELSTYETRFSSRGESFGRARNIEISAAELDGALLRPGDILSFNEIVGERTEARGYREAKEWRRGELVDGIGGGVCQTAATLFAAAYMAGLEILQQHPHTRPARYIETGLDTSVAWPRGDLQIRNPYRFPMRLRVTAFEGRLRVTLLGTGTLDPVEWSAEVVEEVAGEQAGPDAGIAGPNGMALRPVGSAAEFDDGQNELLIRRTRTVHRSTGAIVEETLVRYEARRPTTEGSAPTAQ